MSVSRIDQVAKTHLKCREIGNFVLQILDQVLVAVWEGSLPALRRIKAGKVAVNRRSPMAASTDLSAEAFTTPVIMADVELDGFAASRAART